MACMAYNPTCTITATYHDVEWEIPRFPFVEYEKADEKWAKALGHGEPVVRHRIRQFNQAIIEQITIEPDRSSVEVRFRAFSDQHGTITVE
jgi:hypothetical protein